MNKVKVNGYEFEVDERTGTMIASGALSVGKTAPRTHRAAKAGGSRHEESDHDGHGIAARFNGPTIEENLSAMNGKINQGSYKRMENAEVALLKTGASVQTERIAYAYSPKAEDGGVRPEAYLVNDTVTYNNREKQHIHLSFTNMEPKEQGKMNDVVSNMEMPEILNQGDRLREQMTAVQYAELMESTDQYLPDVWGEFCQGNSQEPVAGSFRAEIAASGEEKSSGASAAETRGGENHSHDHGHGR